MQNMQMSKTLKSRSVYEVKYENTKQYRTEKNKKVKEIFR